MSVLLVFWQRIFCIPGVKNTKKVRAKENSQIDSYIDTFTHPPFLVFVDWLWIWTLLQCFKDHFKLSPSLSLLLILGTKTNQRSKLFNFSGFLYACVLLWVGTFPSKFPDIYIWLPMTWCLKKISPQLSVYLNFNIASSDNGLLFWFTTFLNISLCSLVSLLPWQNYELASLYNDFEGKITCGNWFRVKSLIYNMKECNLSKNVYTTHWEVEAIHIVSDVEVLIIVRKCCTIKTYSVAYNLLHVHRSKGHLV